MSEAERLIAEYKRIQRAHKRALVRTVARSNLGGAVIRVYDKGTKEPLLAALTGVRFDLLRNVRSQTEFRKWFNRELNRIAGVIRRKNPRNKRIRPGLKWGHAAKVLCLLLRGIVQRSDYFDRRVAKRLMPYLYQPMDSKVIGRLARELKILPAVQVAETDRRREEVLRHSGEAGHSGLGSPCPARLVRRQLGRQAEGQMTTGVTTGAAYPSRADHACMGQPQRPLLLTFIFTGDRRLKTRSNRSEKV